MNLVWTFSFLIFLLSIFYSCEQEYNLSCDPVQYLQLATLNIINCSISKPFDDVYWYNTSDNRRMFPVVRLEGNVTSGQAFTSGEFDIHCNGSLIINNVSFVHEHEFKVVVIYPNDANLEATVRVIVFGESTSLKPKSTSSEPEQSGTDVTTDGTQLPQEQKEETSKLVFESTWMIFGIAASAVAVLLISGILLCSCIHSKHRRARNVNEHDDISARSYPMQRLEPGEYEEGTEDVNMKLTFIRELKEFYKTFCKEQLCFSVRNNLKFFPDVFVENCLQLVGSTSPERGVYHKMFADAALKRVILVGNPGIGKTTITLKAAYDWCSEDSSSPLKNIDIFILLRLGDISQENSLSSAIKTRLLPKDSQIKEDCIKRFIRAGMSIVIVFDGLEEYCGDGKSTSEISKIIESFMLPNIKVVITTTPLCLPKGIGGEGGTTQIYVRGFNESKCLQYMRRAVGNGGQIFYQNIEKALNESLYLKYFCSVPLLSMMISHMAHYSADLTKITSVTTLFNLYFKRNEDMDAHASETFYSDLYEKAFNTLTSTDKEFTLCSEDFVQPIAEDFYRKFVGVLIKSTGTSNSVSEGGATANTPGKVYFSHQLFQQWFAAHHLVKILKNTPEDLVNQSLTKIEPCRVPYLLRFACGLSKTATKQIIQYIGNDERNQSLVILCICEKDRCFSLMESAMKQLLLKPVRFYKDNIHTDTYLQKATIEFLESASQKEIIISKLEFHSCLQSFTKTSDNLTVSSSGLTIPTLKTLQCLEVHEPNRQIKINEVAAIINISSSYKMLTKLSFISTKQPHNFSDKEFVASLGGIHFKVYWTTRDQDHYFVLNNQSGIWEIPGPVLSPIDGEQFTYPTK